MVVRRGVGSCAQVGTPLVAVGDGLVVETSQENTLTGVAVCNLFKWNSVMLQLDTGDASAASVSSPSLTLADDASGTAATGATRGGSGVVGDGGQTATTAGAKHSNSVGGSGSGGGSSVRGGDLFVEYVHIRAGSCCVQVGERVVSGQKICESGSVGFSPEPHLHFTAFRSREPTAPTTRVRFRAAAPAISGGGEGVREGGGGGGGRGGGEDGAYTPVAGKYYNAEGAQPAPAPPPHEAGARVS